MTPSERIDHIRQCLRNMKPVMGYEIAYAATIGAELDELQRIFTLLDEYADRLMPQKNGGTCDPGTPTMLEAMTRSSLNGDTCG